MWCVFLAAISISVHYKNIQETKDEYYEMLQKISTHLVGYCPLTYFRDKIVTVTIWIWVEFIRISEGQSFIN